MEIEALVEQFVSFSGCDLASAKYLLEVCNTKTSYILLCEAIHNTQIQACDGDLSAAYDLYISTQNSNSDSQLAHSGRYIQ
jgi:hypothetical protein